MLRLAFECGRAGLSAPTVFNAANEIAVERFLRGEIYIFSYRTCCRVCSSHNIIAAKLKYEAIIAVDQEARTIAGRI